MVNVHAWSGGQAQAPGPMQPERVTQKPLPAPLPEQPQRGEWHAARSSIAIGVVLLLAAAGGLAAFVACMPRPNPDELQVLLSHLPPRSLASVVALRDGVRAYAQAHPAMLAAAILLLYVIMQTFAIPGTIGLSLLMGALYGSGRAFALVAAVSTLGSCCCYCMSAAFGRPVARALWGAKLDAFSAEVSARAHDLLPYLVFLRVTPILPNVFINVASPIVGVPLRAFFLGTLVGCAPNNLMAVHAGEHLSELTSLADVWSGRMVALGLGVGCAALAPAWLKHRHEAAARKAR